MKSEIIPFEAYKIIDNQLQNNDSVNIFIPLWKVKRKSCKTLTEYWFGLYIDYFYYSSYISGKKVDLFSLLKDLIKRNNFASNSDISIKALNIFFLDLQKVNEKIQNPIFDDIDFIKELSYEEVISICYNENDCEKNVLWTLMTSK